MAGVLRLHPVRNPHGRFFLFYSSELYASLLSTLFSSSLTFSPEKSVFEGKYHRRDNWRHVIC